MLITFEGMDGTGKTTQIQLLKQELERKGCRVTVTREPGGSPVAEKIRALLLDRENDMDAMTEAYLYAAARAEHVRRVIRPALERGEVVLCDRYVDSSVAYQGYGRELTPEVVWEINRRAVGDCLPDRTYLLTMEEEAASKRVNRRGEKDRIESAGDDFARRVAQGFERIAEQQPQRVCVIDAAQSVEDIARQIAEDVANLKTCPVRRG